ncbi:MAG TPA: 16S rRNA (cytosine(1402)-N(4))-methyltransferase RsmH [Burkholderiales bacterium]|jgi:16S rRNA (cytosine1402-N4)-methyltransferase|nr:16S rRNA (cytosine(1402)-N(4))-methyltransferase RsmH [Burkholderiales bacterium]
MSAHRAVLLEEALTALALKPGGAYVDATFGRGGHSRALLERLAPSARLVALDRDPQAIAAAQEIRDPRFSAVHAPFSELGRALARLGIEKVDGVLADLGVSSPQLEDPARGFSFRHPGPLDMRMDPTRGMTAAEWLAKTTEKELREAIASYGEERFAKQVAKAIAAARAREPLVRTEQLAAVVAEAIPTRERGQDPATRTFQALRILVNRELEEVALMLPQALSALAPGGRIAVISFHSLEDRLVKRFFAAASRPDVPENLPIRASEMPQAPLTIVGRVTRPTDTEVSANPRARSAKLRAAERTGARLDPAFLKRISEHEPDAWRS